MSILVIFMFFHGFRGGWQLSYRSIFALAKVARNYGTALLRRYSSYHSYQRRQR